MGKMYEMYCEWIAKRNNQIIVDLPKEQSYYQNLLKTNPTQALLEYNLVPIRCYDTFLKMRSEFRIRHYKGKNWR